MTVVRCKRVQCYKNLNGTCMNVSIMVGVKGRCISQIGKKQTRAARTSGLKLLEKKEGEKDVKK
jgi:hypothetical protein